MEIKNSMVRVHITRELWDCGVLWPFFEDAIPDVTNVPIYFRATNCAFDQDSGCYVFKLPFLREEHGIADVYVPREFVLGMSVERDVKSSPQEMSKLGFKARV
jgi:hypothetical protein